MRFEERLRSIRLPSRKAFLIGYPPSVFYLSGSDFRGDAYLLLLSDRAYIISDSRYKEELAQVNRRVPSLRPVEIELDLVSTVATLLPKRVGELLVDRGIGVYLLDDLARRGKVKVAFAKDQERQMRGMRMRKSKEEIRVIRENIRLHRELMRRWSETILGLSEVEARGRWMCMLYQVGCEGPAFDPIVAVGPHASRPHYRVETRTKITGKRPLLFDAGLRRKGYCTDLTRMFFVDTIEGRFRRFFELVSSVQEKILEMIRPGVPARDLDSSARRLFRAEGVDKYFLHALGHGVGIEVHEGPSISSRSQDILEEGMVFTIEPGLYIPGKLGIRLEEMVLVTKTGCEVLSR